MTMRPMARVSARPIFVQLLPPSVDLYTPSPQYWERRDPARIGGGPQAPIGEALEELGDRILDCGRVTARGVRPGGGRSRTGGGGGGPLCRDGADEHEGGGARGREA